MKRDLWLIVVVIMVLAALAGMMAFNTIIGQQQRRIREDEKEKAGLKAEIVSLRAELVVERTPEPYSLPLEQLWISSGTGYRADPMGGAEEALHEGLDFSAPKGTPVFAILSGFVVEHYLVPGWHNGKEYFGDPFLGAKIVLDHGDGLYSIYGHFSKTEVHEGEWIMAGDKIGEVGNTGISTGPHLHLAVVVDPLRYLGER